MVGKNSWLGGVLFAGLLACSASDSDDAGSTEGAGAGSSGTPSGNGAGATTGNGGSGASGTASTGSSGTGSGAAPGDEVLVAFIGDSGNGSEFKSVLDLAMAEDVDAIIHNGDFDYGLDPDGFFATVDGKVGGDFPYFASVGNHDAPSWSEYSVYIKAHMEAAGATVDNDDFSDQKFAFFWRSLHFVFVGENGQNDEFASFIDEQLDPAADEWKICGWHKNQEAMQIGGKGDEMGWDVYENCRMNGAIVTTGHEHSYERTKTLTNMTAQQVDGSCSDPASVCVSPGRTIAIVSGLGGVGIRDQERCQPSTAPYGCNGEWASIYASDQNATYGALFIRFNAGGDTKKAEGYFKNVDGAVVDQFTIQRGE